MRTKKDEPSRRLQILNLLAASEEPLNKYKICERLKEWSEPTILHDIDALEKEHVIRVVRTDMKATGWKPSKHYDLSVTGLSRLLMSAPGKWVEQHAEALITKYEKLIPDLSKAIVSATLGHLDGEIQKTCKWLEMVAPGDETGELSRLVDLLKRLRSFIQKSVP